MFYHSFVHIGQFPQDGIFPGEQAEYEVEKSDGELHSQNEVVELQLKIDAGHIANIEDDGKDDMKRVEDTKGENHAFVAEMREKAKFANSKLTTIDGVRADFADGWGLVRASNTTPILVLRFDADTEESLQRIQEVFKQQMLAINDQLKLPF